MKVIAKLKGANYLVDMSAGELRGLGFKPGGDIIDETLDLTSLFARLESANDSRPVVETLRRRVVQALARLDEALEETTPV